MNNHIEPETWIEYHSEPFKGSKEITIPDAPEIMAENLIITIHDVEEALKI